MICKSSAYTQLWQNSRECQQASSEKHYCFSIFSPALIVALNGNRID
jgi:hypothetical protein